MDSKADIESSEDSPRAAGAFEYVRMAVVLVGLYVLYYVFLALLVPISSAVDGVPDDAFYYLQVARNIALGNGSSFDGIELTNGYHPLWMGLLVPVYAFTGPDSEVGMRGALALSAVLGAGILWWLRDIAQRELGAFAAVVSLLIFAWPRFFGQTVNLLETGLLLFLYLTIIGLRSRFSADPSGWTMRRELGFGVVLGLACLARLDTVFLLAAFGLTGLVAATRRGRNASGSAMSSRSSYLVRAWSEVRVLVVPVLVVLPYLLWNLGTFGHLQPISGAMKSSFPHVQPTFRYVVEFPEFALLIFIGLGYNRLLAAHSQGGRPHSITGHLWTRRTLPSHLHRLLHAVGRRSVALRPPSSHWSTRSAAARDPGSLRSLKPGGPTVRPGCPAPSLP